MSVAAFLFYFYTAENTESSLTLTRGPFHRGFNKLCQMLNSELICSEIGNSDLNQFNQLAVSSTGVKHVHHNHEKPGSMDPRFDESPRQQEEAVCVFHPTRIGSLNTFSGRSVWPLGSMHNFQWSHLQTR